MGNECLELFKNYLETTKKCSKNTLEAYLRDVNQFILYCSQNGAKSIEKVKDNYIIKYIEYLTFIGKSDATKTRIIASLHSYFNFLFSIFNSFDFILFVGQFYAWRCCYSIYNGMAGDFVW